MVYGVWCKQLLQRSPYFCMVSIYTDRDTDRYTDRCKNCTDCTDREIRVLNLITPFHGLYGLYSFYNGLYHGLYHGLYVRTMN